MWHTNEDLRWALDWLTGNPPLLRLTEERLRNWRAIIRLGQENRLLTPDDVRLLDDQFEQLERFALTPVDPLVTQQFPDDDFRRYRRVFTAMVTLQVRLDDLQEMEANRESS